MPGVGYLIGLAISFGGFWICYRFVRLNRREKFNYINLSKYPEPSQEEVESASAMLTQLMEEDKNPSTLIKSAISHIIYASFFLFGIIYFYKRLASKNFNDFELLFVFILCVLGFVACSWWTYQEIRDRNK